MANENEQNEYLSKLDTRYLWNRLKTLFTFQTDFDELESRVEDIISEGGEPNTINTIKVNGSPLTPDTDKTIDVTVPTALSELTNDADYQTAQDVSDALSTALADVTGISYEAVSELPSTGEQGVIYLVPKTGGTSPNVKDEYIWTGSDFEKIGDTDVDLSGYWSKSDLVPMTTEEIDEILNS